MLRQAAHCDMDAVAPERHRDGEHGMGMGMPAPLLEEGASERPRDLEREDEASPWGRYEVLDRLEEVGPEDAEAIAEAWRSTSKSDRETARKAVRKLTERDEEISRHVQMAREEIGAWLAVAAEYPEFVKAVPNWARICSQVSDAALDAATGIILEEDLEEPDYEALFLPWTDAIEKLRVEKELQEIEGVAEDDDVEEEEDDEDDTDGAGDFGPNSDSVADFLNRLWLLSPEQVSRLVSGWPPRLAN